MTLPVCSNRHVVFIIHWKLSCYTTYFFNLLKEIKLSNKVTLIDCSVDGYENDFTGHESFYDHYLTFRYGDNTDELIAKIKHHAGNTVVISNSIRNELQPGANISSKFNSEHILFEHLSSLVNVEQSISSFTIENLDRIKTIFIPSLAIKPFFLRFKSADCIHVQTLDPATNFFSEINKKQKTIKQMIYAGRLIPEKNILNFLKLNKDFFESNKVRFVIVGSGEQDKILQKYRENNEWISHVPQGTPLEVQSMIDESMAVVVPSPQESYSMLAVEGLLRGTPVLMQNTGIGIGLHGKIPGLFKLPEDLILTTDIFESIQTFDSFEKTATTMRGYLRANNKSLFELINRD